MSPTEHNTPRRRCVVCRTTESRAALLRFVWDDDQLVFDARGKAPGRGVHVCPRLDCLERAIRGAFRRSAKGRTVTLPDPDRWIEQVILPGLWAQYRELVSVGRQSGRLVAGSETVQRHARTDELAGYMMAVDASAGTRRKFGTNADRKALPVLGLLERAELGALIGRDNPVVLGWLPGPLFERMCEIEKQIKELSGTQAESEPGSGPGRNTP